MPVGKTQVYNTGLRDLLQNADDQWDAVGTLFAYILLDGAHLFADADSTYADVSVDEIPDADYGALDVITRAVNQSGVNVFIDAADATFGNPVTIAALFLVCVMGLNTALVAGDPLVFRVDLGPTRLLNTSVFTGGPFTVGEEIQDTSGGIAVVDGFVTDVSIDVNSESGSLTNTQLLTGQSSGATATLNTQSKISTNVSSVSAEFTVQAPANGWLGLSQA